MAQGASAAASTDLELASWRGRWASAVALIAAIGLVVLLGLVTTARQDRDAALKLERNTYEAMQLARSVDLSIARAEAAMGRYVLDANQQSASQYYQEWRLAARQIGQLRALPLDQAQLQRVDELRRLFNLRGQELSVAAAASKRREGLTGLGLFYRAAQSPTLPQLSAQLEAIVRAGRQTLQERVTGHGDRRRADRSPDPLARLAGPLDQRDGDRPVLLGLSRLQRGPIARSEGR
jgi:CHASE3 domain sensor protein